ncbi:MAG: TolC family protein [Chitinophagaceae bacterium]
MRKYVHLSICFLLTGLVFTQSIFAQPIEKWDLQKCVDYALKNNISVRQTDLQSRFSALTLKQTKATALPTFNFSGNAGNSFGLSNNPVTGIYTDNSFFSVGAQLQSQITIFNWFYRKNLIAADKLTYEADLEQTKKIQNDVALNVAVAYLQILLAREQVNIADIQIQQTLSQLESTRKQVDAGRLPELNYVQIESQLATDSSNFITAQTSAQQFVLQLKALLNLDAGKPFDIEAPPVDRIPVESLAELQPESVYTSALANLPQQKVNDLRIKSAIKSSEASRATMYPSITAFGSLSTNYAKQKKIPVYDTVNLGYKALTGIRTVIAPGIYGNIEQEDIENTNTINHYLRSDAFFKQFRGNFGQNIGIGLSVPIFNGRAARTAWERSKLTVKNLELTKEQSDQQLKQDIYKAYTDATASIQKFNANKKGVEAAQKAYDFAKKRYDLGLLSTFELLNTQNALQTSKTQLAYAQFDYVFKMKLLEFYKGQGLKL